MEPVDPELDSDERVRELESGSDEGLTTRTTTRGGLRGVSKSWRGSTRSQSSNDAAPEDATRSALPAARRSVSRDGLTRSCLRSSDVVRPAGPISSSG
jgi:hypothetical protein